MKLLHILIIDSREMNFVLCLLRLLVERNMLKGYQILKINRRFVETNTFKVTRNLR